MAAANEEDDKDADEEDNEDDEEEDAAVRVAAAVAWCRSTAALTSSPASTSKSCPNTFVHSAICPLGIPTGLVFGLLLDHALESDPGRFHGEPGLLRGMRVSRWHRGQQGDNDSFYDGFLLVLPRRLLSRLTLRHTSCQCGGLKSERLPTNSHSKRKPPTNSHFLINSVCELS